MKSELHTLWITSPNADGLLFPYRLFTGTCRRYCLQDIDQAAAVEV
jgi:hypothetical protein